jgi:hypothetical protein
VRQKAQRQLAIGYVFFDDRNLPPTTRFKFAVTATPGTGDGSKTDLQIKTLRYVGGHLVGIARNVGPKKISSRPGVFAACFSPSNRIIAFHSGFADRDSVPVRAEAPFTLDFTIFRY